MRQRQGHVHVECDGRSRHPGLRLAFKCLRRSLSAMSLGRSRIGTLLVLLSATGCMKPYVPPQSHEPHAVVKYRRHYEKVAGTTLFERLVIDDTLAFGESVSPDVARVAQTDALLVHPGSAHVELDATFSHQVTRTVQESYSCGTSQSPQTCYRSVSRQETVVDGACHQELGLVVSTGETYLLQLNFQDSNNCSSTCLRQTSLGGGKFKNEACVVFQLPED